ncbi:hypothetical protein BHMPCIPO_06431 [Ensifer sesbaniae]|nr:hypothetical protein [Ensifer sesbaniae]
MNMNDARHLRWIAGAGAAFFACGAAAADLTSSPVVHVAEDVATGLSHWQIRVRGLGVITEDSGSINGVPGSDLSYSDSLSMRDSRGGDRKNIDEKPGSGRAVEP